MGCHFRILKNYQMDSCKFTKKEQPFDTFSESPLKTQQFGEQNMTLVWPFKQKNYQKYF